MTTTVNACGLSCPQPVIMATDAIKKGHFPIEVIVETVTSRENVRRAAESQGCVVEVTQLNDQFKLVLRK